MLKYKHMFERYKKEGTATKDAIRYTKNDEELRKVSEEYLGYLRQQQQDPVGNDIHTTAMHEAAIRKMLLENYQIKLKPMRELDLSENPDTAVYEYAKQLCEPEESQEMIQDDGRIAA